MLLVYKLYFQLNFFYKFALQKYIYFLLNWKLRLTLTKPKMVNIILGLQRIGSSPRHTFAQAMTIEPDGDAAYIIGGWGTDSQCSVYRIELPENLCSLHPTKHSCLQSPGCGYCASQHENSVIDEVCHSNTKECPIGNLGYTSSKIFFFIILFLFVYKFFIGIIIWKPYNKKFLFSSHNEIIYENFLFSFEGDKQKLIIFITFVNWMYDLFYDVELLVRSFILFFLMQNIFG